MAGKKGGKTAPKTKAPEVAAEATQEQAKEKQINLLVKTDNISDRTTKGKDGNDKTFKSCRIPVQIDGETKFASLAVDAGRVKQATKVQRDDKNEIIRDENGKAKTEPIEGYSNVWLRGESQKIKLNVQMSGEGKNAVYEDKTFTAGEVKSMNDAAKKAYKASQNSKSKEAENAGLTAPEAEEQVEL
jgi:hypothetical protein